MTTNQVTPLGALLFIVVSIIYLIAFLFVQFKIFDRRGKKAERFCEQAQRDGRMVDARRVDYRIVSTDDGWEYVGKYVYTAPNGRQYKMRWRDCQGYCTVPPETITLYLESRNYRKYHVQGSLNMGKHGSPLFLLSLAVGFIVYLVLIRFVISPIIMP